VKEFDELVRLRVLQPVATRVLDERELRVDPLADCGSRAASACVGGTAYVCSVTVVSR